MTTTLVTTHAKDLMSRPAISVLKNASMAEAAEIMIKKNIGCLPVLDEEGRFLGMITERAFQAELAGVRPISSLPLHERTVQQLYVIGPDRLSQVEEGLRRAKHSPVGESMVEGEPTVSEDAELWQVAETMFKAGLSHIAVVEDGRPVGVIARHDLLKAYAGR